MFPEELKQYVPLAGRISHFVQSWEKLTKDQEILEIVNGYKIPLLRIPVQEKNSFEYTPKRKSEISSGKRDQRDVGEGSNKESLATQRSACSKSISEQSFPCTEKRWGLPPGYKSENAESVCAFICTSKWKVWRL